MLGQVQQAEEHPARRALGDRPRQVRVVGQARRLEMFVEQQPVGRGHPGDDGDAIEVHGIGLQAGQHRAHGLSGLLIRVRGQDDPGRDRVGHLRGRRRGAEDGLQLLQQAPEWSVPIRVARDAQDCDHLGPSSQGLHEREVRAAQPAGQVEDHGAQLVDRRTAVPDGRGRQDEQIVAVEVAGQA